MIQVTPTIAIPENELDESFIQAGGPGGQNVNKVATAVQLRFDARASPSLPDRVRFRLMHLAGRRLTKEGVIVIDSREHRTRERNREAALARLTELIVEAAKPPPPKRRPTRPTLSSKRERLDTKTRRGAVKRLRGRADD